MRVISRRALREFWEVQRQAEAPLSAWYRVMHLTRFKDFLAVKTAFPAADYVAPYTIFDIGGNKFRLIARIYYDTGRVYVHDVQTHSEYDRWSDDNRRRKRPTRGK